MTCLQFLGWVAESDPPGIFLFSYSHCRCCWWWWRTHMHCRVGWFHVRVHCVCVLCLCVCIWTVRFCVFGCRWNRCRRPLASVLVQLDQWKYFTGVLLLSSNWHLYRYFTRESLSSNICMDDTTVSKWTARIIYWWSEIYYIQESRIHCIIFE